MKEFILKHKKLVIGLAVALVVLAGVGIAVAMMSSSSEESTKNNSYTVDYGNIESTVSGKGYVQAGSEVKIVAPVGVTVKEVLVKVGDSVGAGQALANIEPASINGKLAEAQAKETEIQNQLDKTQLTTYERDALIGQRTAVRSYISQLRDLRNYPVITAPQNGVINNIYLVDGAPITVQNTMDSQGSGSDSSSSTSNVSLMIPTVRTNNISVARNDILDQQQITRLNCFTDSLLLVPLYHFLLNSEFTTNLFSPQRSILEQSLFKENAKIVEISDSETPVEGTPEGSDVFGDEQTFINGRSDFVPDIYTSNADYSLLEGGSTENGQGSQNAGDSNKLPSDYFSSSGSMGSSGSGADVQQISDFTTYDATVFKLGSMDQLLVNILVDERDILNIQPGQEAKITLEALPDEEFVGNISTISGAAQTSDGNSKYSVDVTLNTDRPLKSGMSANVKISTGSNQNVLIIPIEALQDQNNRKYVYTTESEDGTLGGEVDVTTGLSNADYVEITGGLQKGQVIYYPKQNTSDDFTSELMSDGDEESTESSGGTE